MSSTADWGLLPMCQDQGRGPEEGSTIGAPGRPREGRRGTVPPLAPKWAQGLSVIVGSSAVTGMGDGPRCRGTQSLQPHWWGGDSQGPPRLPLHGGPDDAQPNPTTVAEPGTRIFCLPLPPSREPGPNTCFQPCPSFLSVRTAAASSAPTPGSISAPLLHSRIREQPPRAGLEGGASLRTQDSLRRKIFALLQLRKVLGQSG